MATRIYLPSTGSPPVTPSTWNFANQINPVSHRGVTTKSSTALTTKTEATGTVSPTLRAMFRYVIGPLAAQSISGTINGRMQCSENNAGANATMAIAVKLIQPNGADRSVLLAAVGSDNAAAPQEFATTLTNRAPYNTTEVNPVPLTTQSATAGDYLVIEIGFRSATTTSRNISMRYGDDGATDLPADTTNTVQTNVPWFELSANLVFLHSATAALQIGAAEFAAVAEHVPPTSTAAALLTLGNAEFSASAEFSGPVTATADLPLGNAEFTATASFQETFTGAAALSLGSIEFAALASHYFAHPVGSLTQLSLLGLPGGRYGDFSGKTLTPPMMIAEAALALGSVEFVGVATTWSAHPVDALTQLSLLGLPGGRYGDFSGKGVTSSSGSAALSLASVQLVASATFEQPTYTSTATLSLGGVAFSSAATFAPPTATGAAPLALAGIQFTASAEHDIPVYTGTAPDLEMPPITIVAEALFVAPGAGAIALLVLGNAEFSSVATFVSPTYQATATLPLGNVEFTASAVHAAAVFTASAPLMLGNAEFAATATFVSVHQAVANLALGEIGFTALATFEITTADAILMLSGAEVSATAEFDAPTLAAIADLVLGAVEFTASTSPGFVTVQAVMSISSLDIQSLSGIPVQYVL